MKKLFMLLLMTVMLTACGEKINTTSRSYKKELLAKIYEEHDKEAKQKYREIIAELESIESPKADDEIERWEELEADYQAKALQKMSEEAREVAKKFKAKKGNGW